ncbi:TetR/AcrR family transcriptional regulator, partial [Staphylococcus aureus]
MVKEKFNSYDRRNTRAVKIKQAAYDLFNELPFADITMTMIAERAHVAKGTIFNYFRSKEDIFMAIILSGYLNYCEQMEASLMQTALADKAAVKQFFVEQTKIMAEQYATIILFNSLRRFSLEFHGDREQTEHGRIKIYEIHQRIWALINAQIPEISIESIGHALVVQSAIFNGLMNLGNMEKFNGV